MLVSAGHGTDEMTFAAVPCSSPLAPRPRFGYNLPMTNTLFYGDNLAILGGHVGDATVDLVYLDPPFNSNRDYNRPLA